MIVRNEELALPRVLSVAHVYADEIIIVDTGSTDKTVDIALKANCKVYPFEWTDDFAAARNYAFSLAKGDYVMWLDADDVITDRRARRIAALKQNLTADVVMLPYHMGDPPTLVFWRERILKRDMGFAFKGRVHEAVEVSGNIIYENIPVVHDKLKSSEPKRNLRILEKVLKEKGDLVGREAFYYGSELYYNRIYDDAVFWLSKSLDGVGSNADKGQALLFISNMRSALSQKKEALLKGLSYSFAPDLLCPLGDIFLSEKNLKAAKTCFLTALVADERITFSSPDLICYMPHIRLCYCYWHLGDLAKAKFHNDMALKAKPNDIYALTNAKLFK